MKYLGIDFGAKRVGLAISDEGGSIAFPYEVVQNSAALVASLLRIIEKEKIEAVVVGDTRSTSGMANPVSAAADAFVEQLERSSGKAVERVFEMWSSIEASRYAPDDQQHDDRAAAAIILQRYFDMKKGGVE